MMKCNFLFVVLMSLVVSCSTKEEKASIKTSSFIEAPSFEVPTNTIDKSNLEYDRMTSTWTLDNVLYSGYAVSYYQDSTLKQKFGILNGKKQNESTDWFPDGRVKYLVHYHQGKLHGEKKSWSVDSTHHLLSHFNYRLGKAHGIQKQWYTTGEIYKVLELNNGREEGLQQAFRKNGILYANYEAREGRIFGLRRAALCYELEDEEIQI